MDSNLNLSAQLTFLESRLYLEHSDSYKLQLWILRGVLGVSLGLALLSLIVRTCNGTIWFYRIQKTAYGSWLSPNANGCWLVWNAVTAILLQIHIVYLFRLGTPGEDLRDSQIWRCVVWIPLWLGAVNMTSATVLAPIVSQGFELDQSKPHRFDISFFPSLVTVPFIFYQLGGIALIVSFTLILNNHFNRMFDAVQDLIPLVQSLAGIDYSQLPANVLDNQQEAQVLMAEVAQYSSLSIIWARRVWIAWVVVVGSTLLLFTLAALVHFHHLRDQIQSLKSDSSTLNGLPTSTRRMKALVWTYRTWLFNALVIKAIGVGYVVLCVFAVIEVDQPMNERVILCSLYVFAFFTALSNLLILYRSFTPSTARPSTPLSPAGSSPRGFSQLNTLSPQASPQSPITRQRIFP
ncbi:hypothetical protein T439DRAFT_328928 [Meredithblackwellia eburnea MCA 4105]